MLNFYFIYPYLIFMEYPKYLIPMLRTDHAGETGAVFIYRAILMVARDDEIICFAKKHLKTESEHLILIEQILEKKYRSKLIPLWKVAGFLTGFLPSFFGKKTILATIFYVESFVEKHYQQQIDALGSQKKYKKIKKLLKSLQDDEVLHKDEALFEAKNFNKLQKFWGSFVEKGSLLAVRISQKI